MLITLQVKHQAFQTMKYSGIRLVDSISTMCLLWLCFLVIIIASRNKCSVFYQIRANCCFMFVCLFVCLFVCVYVCMCSVLTNQQQNCNQWWLGCWAFSRAWHQGCVFLCIWLVGIALISFVVIGQMAVSRKLLRYKLQIINKFLLCSFVLRSIIRFN